LGFTGFIRAWQLEI